MFGGIVLIGVLASFLASFFLAPPKSSPEPSGVPQDQVARLLGLLAEQERANASIRAQLEDLRKTLAA
jgi:hypothetical protein